MALCADAEVRDGGLIGDPTEGALVVLAAKGGIDPVATRETYPRVAELPFDAAYKFMATFHRMTDESGKDVMRAFVKGAPDQLLDRSEHRPRRARRRSRRPASTSDSSRRTARSARGPAGHGRRAARFRPGDVRRRRGDMLDLMQDLTLLAMVGIVDPPRAEAKVAIAKSPQRRHPGPDDHRRPCRDRRGDRDGAGHPRAGPSPVPSSRR